MITRDQAAWLAFILAVGAIAAVNWRAIRDRIRKQFVSTGQRVRDQVDGHLCRCRICGSPLEVNGECVPCREWDAIVNDASEAVTVIRPTAIVTIPDADQDPVGHYRVKAWLAIGELPQACADPFDDLSSRMHAAFAALQRDLDLAAGHALALCGAS